MSEPPRASDNLNELIAQAQAEVGRRSKPPGPGRERRAGLFKPLACLVLVGTGFASAYSAWSRVAAPSRDKVTHDLEVVLQQSRASVEKSRAESGRLPQALPNASRAAVVRYEPGLDDYRLSAAVMGIRVTLSADGTKTTQADRD